MVCITDATDGNYIYTALITNVRDYYTLENFSLPTYEFGDAIDSIKANEARISPWTIAGIVETDLLILAACEPETEDVVRLETLIAHPENFERKVIETSGYSTFVQEERDTDSCKITSVKINEIDIPIYGSRDTAIQTYQIRVDANPDSKFIFMTRGDLRGTCGSSGTEFDKLPTKLQRYKAQVLAYYSVEGEAYYLKYIKHSAPQ